MAILPNGGLNTAGHTYTPFETIPAGHYPMMIISDEMRENSKSDGSHLLVVFQIMDGPHKGRQLWERFNLVNPNAKAVTIALGQMANLTRAILGYDMNVQDTTILHMRPFTGRVVVQAAKGDYGPSNHVADFLRLGSTGSAAAPDPSNPFQHRAPPLPPPPPPPQYGPGQSPLQGQSLTNVAAPPLPPPYGPAQSPFPGQAPAPQPHYGVGEFDRAVARHAVGNGLAPSFNPAGNPFPQANTTQTIQPPPTAPAPGPAAPAPAYAATAQASSPYPWETPNA